VGTRLGRDDMTRSSKDMQANACTVMRWTSLPRMQVRFLSSTSSSNNLWRESGSVERSCARRVRSVAIVPFNVTQSPMNYPDDAVSSITLIGGTG